VNCREAERLIDTFFDGELDGRSMRDAAMHITRCKRCEAELNERESIQKLLSHAIEGEIADIDLGRIWAAVEPTLDQGAVRGLPGLLGFGRAGSPRLAATSAGIGGILLGRKPADDQDAELDSIDWKTPDTRRGRVWQWSLAGGAALAASVLLAVALLPSAQVASPPGTSVQAAGLAGAERTAVVADVARGPSQPQVVAQRAPIASASSVPFEVARTEPGHATRAANKQVQVESVNFPRSSVAMWSEPATDTTVIWIEDEEQAASGRR
jgi:hypothetical protein